MVSESREALQRLKERIRSSAAAQWLDEARVSRRGGRTILRVSGVFQKSWFESRCSAELEEVFGGPVEVVADAAPVSRARFQRAVPCLRGPAGEFALRMVRAFATRAPIAGSLLVVHGGPRSGKSLLMEWACRLGGSDVFLLDVMRLRQGRSRGLVPRKPLVVADGLEALAGRRPPQQTLCTIVDTVQDRGGRLLFTVEGHPAVAGLSPALRSRLLGGVLVPVEPEQIVRRRTRGVAGPEPETPESLLGGMKDVAARLFGVERALLNGATKRRSVVEARRTVIAAARSSGLEPLCIAKAFGLKSERAVTEACRWAAREEERDRRFASVLHEVARVRPKS